MQKKESEKMTRERIDHSVLHYWEKKLARKLKLLLDSILSVLYHLPYQQTIADSTIGLGKRIRE